MKQNQTQTVEQLVQGAKAGDREAQSELYSRYYNTIYYTAKTIVKDEDTALDIVQDSFLKAFTHMEMLNNPRVFPAWVKRIATNNAKNWLRKRNPMLFSQIAETDEEGQEMPVEVQDMDLTRQPEEALDARTKKELLWAIIDTLSDEQRLVVNMFYFQGLPVAQIAAELGVSQNTVKSRLNYARKRIEAKVLDLEKQGTKLYGLAPVPFLAWLFFQNQQFNPALPVALSGAAGAGTASAQGTAAAGTASAQGSAAAGTATAGTATAGTVNGAAAVGGMAAAGGAAASGSTALATGAVVKTAGVAVAKGLGVKIAAAVAGVALVGGTAAGVSYVQPWKALQPAAQSTAQVEVTPAPQEAAPAEVPAATEAPSPTPAAVPLTGLHAAEEYQDTQNAYYDVQNRVVYRIDYATAQRTALVDVSGVPDLIYTSIGNGEVYATSLGEPSYVYVYSLEDGSLLRTMQVDFAYHFDYMDDQYGYCFEWDDIGVADGYRMDLQTGAGIKMTFPEGMYWMFGAADDKFVIGRVLDGVDLHEYNNPEKYSPEQVTRELSAVNLEVDWWDPITGAVQPILQEPYLGDSYATTGNVTTRYLEGISGDTLYFRLDDYENNISHYETCNRNGGARVLLPFELTDNFMNQAVLQNGELRWLIYTTASGAAVFDVSLGVPYNLGVPYDQVPHVCRLTNDDRVLISTNGQYRLVSQKDFLAGSFTGTTVQDAG